MKRIGTLLAIGLTLLIGLILGVFSFLPLEVSSQPIETDQVTGAIAIETSTMASIVPPATFDMGHTETQLAQREAIYQGQMTQLDQALQERQITYQAQMQLLNTQITTAQNQLDELKAQEQSLLDQINELETGRAEQLAIYQTQLEQAQGQYNQRYTEMQALFDEVQVKLAETKAQLGR